MMIASATYFPLRGYANTSKFFTSSTPSTPFRSEAMIKNLVAMGEFWIANWDLKLKVNLQMKCILIQTMVLFESVYV